jgi:hypothetical protein
MRRVIALAFPALLAAACAHGAPRTDATEIGEALAPARFFVGTWRGTNHDASGRATTLTWTLTPGLEGQWLTGRALARESNVHARDFWGPAAHGFVRVYLDSQGTHGTLHTSGWIDATWVWEGELVTADGTRLRVRETISRQGPRTMHARYEVGRPDGSWRALSEETLERR